MKKLLLATILLGSTGIALGVNPKRYENRNKTHKRWATYGDNLKKNAEFLEKIKEDLLEKEKRIKYAIRLATLDKKWPGKIDTMGVKAYRTWFGFGSLYIETSGTDENPAAYYFRSKGISKVKIPNKKYENYKPSDDWLKETCL